MFNAGGQKQRFFDLSLKANYHKDAAVDEEEYVVKIDWQKTILQKDAVSEYGFFGNQHTVCRPKADKWIFTINRLKELWEIDN